MTQYTIIEDCSPYYIRYTFDGLEELLSLCRSYQLPPRNNIGFQHLKMVPTWSKKILDLTPVSKQMPINEHRVSLFLTEPGFYYGAHKDGQDHRFSLNFTSMVLDDRCLTSWYTDEELAGLEVSTTELPSMGLKNPRPNQSREVLNWVKSKHTPIKSMTAKQDEAILFNTDMFHDFDNSSSSNRRVVLTLRHASPGNVYFEDARKIMFGY